jgi:protein TonB
MKRIFIILLGFSLTACRTLPIEMSEAEVLGEPLEDAEFPGGYEKMQVYIVENMNRNKIIDSSRSLEGSYRVMVKFDVEKDGSISNAVIEKSTSDCLLCEKAALRLVQNMPNWTPAKMNGLPIVSPVRLPLTFTF